MAICIQREAQLDGRRSRLTALTGTQDSRAVYLTDYPPQDLSAISLSSCFVGFGDRS